MAYTFNDLYSLAVSLQKKYIEAQDKKDAEQLLSILKEWELTCSQLKGLAFTHQEAKDAADIAPLGDIKSSLVSHADWLKNTRK